MANEKPKVGVARNAKLDAKIKAERAKLYSKPVSIREFRIHGSHGMVKHCQEETFENGVKKCHVIGNEKSNVLITGRRIDETKEG